MISNIALDALPTPIFTMDIDPVNPGPNGTNPPGGNPRPKPKRASSVDDDTDPVNPGPNGTNPPGANPRPTPKRYVAFWTWDTDPVNPGPNGTNPPGANPRPTPKRYAVSSSPDLPTSAVNPGIACSGSQDGLG
jgi:hypothetical protein